MSERFKGFLQMTALAIVAAGLFWFLQQHWRHASGLLAFAPFLLFLACPLMHLFMHHGHGDHNHEHLQNKSDRSEPRSGA
ncbi:MAG: DUF2933 domain-containing protein [Pseudomonadota bacterium]|jgi:hypothetical protein